MAIHRLKKEKNYVRLDNSMLRNPDLSAKAKMVLGICLSLPDNWVFSIRGLAHFCAEGEDALRAAVGELEQKGYIVRTRKRVNGQYGQMEYDIYEHPRLNPAWAEPGQENPDQALPARADPQIHTIQLPKNDPTNDLSNQSDGLMEGRIREQISYPALKAQYDSRLLDNLVALMADVFAVQTDQISVNRNTCYPTSYVRQRLAMLNADHIDHVMRNLERIDPVIRNTRGYLLTALINAASTMDMSFYHSGE